MVNEMKKLLLKKATYLTDHELERFEKALEFSNVAHIGQKRATGEPYIIHPYSVCEILIDYKADVTTLIAALLHDVVEDTSYTLSHIETNFGQDVAAIVDGLTKMEKGNIPKEAYQAINTEKLLSAAADDIRVAVVKIADRVHNIRTLSVKKVEKKVPYANETLIFFAPLAERLGLFHIQQELEELAFHYVNPPKYEGVKKLLSNYEKVFLQLYKKLSNKLTNDMIQLDWRSVPVYKAASLLQEEHPFSDMFMIELITPNTLDCYTVLGHLHGMFQPKENTFEDNIAIDRGLFNKHLKTVLTINGVDVVVEIKTKEEKEFSKYGVLSHIANASKEEIVALSKRLLRDIHTVKHISNNNPLQFYDLISFELMQKEIEVFTPKMDVITLPEGSTALDFAFHINPSKASKMVTVKVNGEEKSIYTPLNKFDIVEIITGEHPLVKEDWLNYAQTSKAFKIISDMLEHSEGIG